MLRPAQRRPYLSPVAYFEQPGTTQHGGELTIKSQLKQNIVVVDDRITDQQKLCVRVAVHRFDNGFVPICPPGQPGVLPPVSGNYGRVRQAGWRLRPGADSYGDGRPADHCNPKNGTKEEKSHRHARYGLPLAS